MYEITEQGVQLWFIQIHIWMPIFKKGSQPPSWICNTRALQSIWWSSTLKTKRKKCWNHLHSQTQVVSDRMKGLALYYMNIKSKIRLFAGNYYTTKLYQCQLTITDDLTSLTKWQVADIFMSQQKLHIYAKCTTPLAHQSSIHLPSEHRLY